MLDKIRNIEPVLPDSVKRHKLVTNTAKALASHDRQTNVFRRGLLGPARRYAKPTLDIFVCEKSIDRALNLANIFLLTAIKLGAKIAVVEETVHLVFIEEPFCFSVCESTRRVPHVPNSKEKEEIRQFGSSWFLPKWDFEPTDVLRIHLSHATDHSQIILKEAPTRGLEQVVGITLRELPELVQEARQYRKAREEQRKRTKEEEVRRFEDALRERQRKEREEALWQAADRWNKAEQLRRFIDEAERTHGMHDQSGELGNPDWCEWARTLANQVDPLIRPSAESLQQDKANRPGSFPGL